ncbi:ATP-binding protein [Alkalihalobacterium alkalinitrilicum]|uniref:ATP-binding protein n=1 Tax=Alkalihalobacterium alkalinitrilicum TaxID=427920 RepID=UPI001C5721C2|nr:ATP-binding protein [Alkalihalobacterium alkalinitrilicum]
MQHIQQSIQKTMTYHSDYCKQHKIEHIVWNDQSICPRCFIEQQDRQLQEQIEDQYKHVQKMKKYNTLYHSSLVSDSTLVKATIESFVPSCEEEQKNKNIVLECIKRYKAGETFNVILQGLQGTGKSHLAYSILKEINETTNYKTSSLFISVEEMLRKIRGSFQDKESKYTENYFVDLMSGVDFLVLDDLGAETGSIDTDKMATDFVQRVLYAIGTTRQDKSTIITTNLSSKALFTMYDRKLVSRLLKNPKYIIFKESKDKRISSIPF